MPATRDRAIGRVGALTTLLAAGSLAGVGAVAVAAAHAHGAASSTSGTVADAPALTSQPQSTERGEHSDDGGGAVTQPAPVLVQPAQPSVPRAATSSGS